MKKSGFSDTQRIAPHRYSHDCAVSEIKTCLNAYPIPYYQSNEPFTICNEIIFRGQKWLGTDLGDSSKQPVGNFEYRIGFDYDINHGVDLHDFMHNTVPEFFIEDVKNSTDMGEKEFKQI